MYITIAKEQSIQQMLGRGYVRIETPLECYSSLKSYRRFEIECFGIMLICRHELNIFTYLNEKHRRDLKLNL